MGRTTTHRNAALHELIVASGCPYEALAAQVNAVGREAGARLSYRAPSIAQWLGGGRPRDPVPVYLAEALARRLGRSVVPADIGMGVPSTAASEAGLRWDTDLCTALDDLGRTTLVRRRSMIKDSVFTLAAVWAVPGWQEIADRGRHAAGTPGVRIGTADVAAVLRMTEAFSEVDDELGSGAVLDTATAFLSRDVVAYLRADAPAEVRRDLCTAASRLAYLVGWFAWDSQDHGLAQRHYMAALKLAAAADDGVSYATVLRGMAVQATGLGHHNAAAHLAERAVSASGGGRAEPRVRAFVLASRAVAAGGQGDPRAAYAHLTASEKALELVDNGHTATGGFHGASMEHTAALVHRGLGATRDAEAAMARSMRLRPHGERRHGAVSASILADLRLDLGHLDEACAVWDQVLMDAEHLRCGRLDTAITDMRTRLRPHSRYPAAAALLARSAP